MRRLLGLREPTAVDGQVPGKIAQRAPRPGSSQSNRTVRPAGSMPRLSSFQFPCTKTCGVSASAVTSGPGSQASGVTTAAARGCHLGQQRPAAFDQLRDKVCRADRRLGDRRPRRQLQVAVHHRDHLEFVARLTRRWREMRAMWVISVRCVGSGIGSSTAGIRYVADVLHQHRRPLVGRRPVVGATATIGW